ncbi:MAG: hypothetical protein LCH46_05660 [Proteobacteria bacterium]|nr:hypothetical protein [Pseudomonadota bacterium]
MKKIAIAALALVTLSAAASAGPIRFHRSDVGTTLPFQQTSRSTDVQGTYVKVAPISEQDYRNLSGADRQTTINRPGTSLRKVVFAKPATEKLSFRERSLLTKKEREAAGQY